jgi:hypothetical protein
VHLRQVRAVQRLECPDISCRGGRHVVVYGKFGSGAGTVRPLLAL